MDNQMTHEIASTKLRGFVLGELDARDMAEVGAHLEACAECTLEERAVRALVAPDVQLSEIERHRLHREVTAATVGARAPRMGSRWSRLMPALGAAAAVLLVLTGIYLGATNLGGSDDLPSAATGGADADAESAPEQPALDDAGGDAAGAASGTASYNYAGSIARTNSDALKRLGKNAFAGAFTTRATDASADSAAAEKGATSDNDASESAALQAEAPPPPLLAECIATVTDAEPEFVPSYSASARYKGEPALVVGFLYPGGGAGALDHFAVYVWSENDCSIILDTIFGTLRD